MLNDFFLSLEQIKSGDQVSLRECIEHLSFNEKGLIPVITQCQETREVLMHAWMNKSAIEKSLATKRVTYWSRSRDSFWIKGETSGNIQELVDMRFDCDGDTILCLVRQHGSACHTGRPNCFYLQVQPESELVHEHLPDNKT